MAEHTDPQARRAHFFSLLQRFDSGMLVTHGRDGTLHARPMVMAHVDPAGDIWLLSDIHAEKVEELTADARASLTLQAAARFVALSGKCEVLRDPRRARELWRPAFAAWFPHGPEHPDTVLLVLRSVHGEYWDHGGERPERHLLAAARALVEGPPPATQAKLGL